MNAVKTPDWDEGIHLSAGPHPSEWHKKKNDFHSGRRINKENKSKPKLRRDPLPLVKKGFWFETIIEIPSNTQLKGMLIIVELDDGYMGLIVQHMFVDVWKFP